MNDTPQRIMGKCIALANEASETSGEVPIAAAIVHGGSGEIVSRSANRVERDGDPTAHAEMSAIRDAAQKLGQKFLSDYDLYVTLEPCAMCAQAISHARIRRLYFGAYDPKSGGVEHGARVFDHPQCHHRPEVIGGVMESECSELLRAFFEGKR